jgi:putative FmdB family regulatory protein
MPLYEYRCEKCGRVTEVLQKVGDRPLRRCEICSGKLEKLISRTSFQLKGGGWYAQGYGDGSKKKATDDTSAAPAEPKKEATPKDAAAPKPKKDKAGTGEAK